MRGIDNLVNQSNLEPNTWNRHRKTREKVCKRVAIGSVVLLLIELMRKWREMFKPVTRRSNVKPKQTVRVTFDTQVKRALVQS